MFTRDIWVSAFLEAIGNRTPTDATHAWAKAWTFWETGRGATPAENNLLNTTEPNTPGVKSFFNTLSDDGHVMNYDTFAHGIQANAKVVRNGDYPVLCLALQTNDEKVLQAAASNDIAKELNTWGTKHAADIVALANNPAGLVSTEEFPGDVPTVSPTAPIPQSEPVASAVAPVAQVTPALNAHGEICDLLDITQFIAGRSPDECVAYSGALLKTAGEPGKGPTESVLQASNLAQFWYGREEGNTLASNRNGMSLQAEHDMLTGMGMTWINVAFDVATVKAWLSHGYPLLICGSEAGMHDMEMGDRVPYPWANISGNHAIVASGIAPDGNLLVHDCANVTSANAIRPGPRKYDASKLQLISATVIVKHWLPVPGPNFDPRVKVMPLPDALAKAGWHDDGHTLYSSGPGALDHMSITGPFREHVLTRANPPWRADDYAMEEAAQRPQLEGSNPGLGSGMQQLFRFSMLCQKDGHTDVIEESVGQELDWSRKKLTEAITKLNALIQRVRISQQPVKTA